MVEILGLELIQDELSMYLLDYGDNLRLSKIKRVGVPIGLAWMSISVF